MTSSDPNYGGGEYYGDSEYSGSARGSQYRSQYYPDERYSTRQYSASDYESERRAERAEAQRESEREAAEQDRKRIIAARTANTIIRVVCFLFAAVLALHIILVIGEANRGNGFYQFINSWASGVSLGFSDLFVPNGPKFRTLLNEGLAAIVWIIIGIVLATLVKRFVMPVPRSRRTW